MAKKTMEINHLAIIPDGNRRWAQRERIFDEEKVYQKGMEHIEETMEAVVELKKRSWTKSLPKVDLLIRTGSWEDPHLSADFLTFLIGEAQLAFPQVFWPDFSKEYLHKILLTYDKRERRFGK